METNSDQASSNNKKSVLYGSLTYFFLLLLAIFWSIHTSFVFIFLGIALFFSFLLIRNLSFESLFYNREAAHENQNSSVDENHILHDLKRTFKETGIAAPNDSTQRSAQQQTQRKVVFVVAGMMAFFFLMIFVGIFSGSDESDAEFYYQQADGFYNAAQYDSAGRYYRKAFVLKPEYKEAIAGYGNVLLMKQQNDSALIMYDKALLIDNEYESALYQKSLTLYYQKRYQESMKEAINLLGLNASYYEAMQLIGDDYYNQDKYDSALTWYDGAYSNGLRNRYLCHLLGYLNQTKGKTQKAIDLYKEALQYDSSVVDIYERLADIVPDNEKEWYKRKISELQSAQ
jgi:tetratricopeptide (TPR) repeat protein